MAAPLVEIRSVAKSFPGVRALERVSLDLEPGRIHALVGENGAGKSTLIKILAGIYPRDEGQILLDGKDIVHISEEEKRKLKKMLSEELKAVEEEVGSMKE